MKLTIDALKKLLSQSTTTPDSSQISNSKSRLPRRRRGNRKRRAQQTLGFETLQPRTLLATFATTDGAWSDPATWDNGVPDTTQRAIISQGITVELDGAQNVAKELVIQGNLIVTEDAAVPEKTLDTRWVHVNSGGLFEVGSEADRYDDASFTLTLNGNDPDSVHTIEGVGKDLKNNDGFLMTAGQGQIQFFGEEKLSFTKLAETAEPAANGIQTITVENIIERNFNKGEISGDEFVKSAGDDGELNWVEGDQIVIASSSYNYTEEEVRIITNVQNNGSTTTLTLDEPLNYRHYGEIETYGNTTAAGTTAASQEYSIDLRAEVALLSRNIKIQSNQDPDNNPRSRDTDVEFGDRENVVYEARFKDANGNPIQSKDVTREMADGDYTLTTRASEVTDASGNLLDGDGDGIGGDDATDNFFRRYGDIDLDGEANFLDISPFIAALTSNEYRLEADANGDGVVNFLDIASFISLLTNS